MYDINDNICPMDNPLMHSPQRNVLTLGTNVGEPAIFTLFYGNSSLNTSHNTCI